MKNIATKAAAILLMSLTFAFAATAQNFKYKVGDKIEALYKGEWYKGEVTGYYAQMYTVKVEALGLTIYPEEKEVRRVGGAAPTNANSNETNAGNNTAKEPQDDSPCADWSAWGIIKKAAFMSFASEKYSTGFTISLHDLICWVKTRKVDFQLTAQEVATVNSLRNSPELIQALKDNYKPERPVDYGKASSIKTGRYACLGRTAPLEVFILPNNEYNTRDTKGKYSFSAATNKITWSTGTFAGGTMTGEYFPNVNAITVYNIKGQKLFDCNLADK
jgi:hypothetical protein